VNVAQARLGNQRLSSAKPRTAADLVRWFGAVQAQDYYGAKWAVGQRMRRATDASLEEAFAAGTILRTHVMRPTWHFVAAEDIRWMLALTAPRLQSQMRGGYRQLELDERVRRQATGVLTKALAGGRHLTRDALRATLARARINTDGQRFAYILMHAELDGVICSGPRIGKHVTYAILDERAPRSSRLDRDEALATLTRRYFRSHGPARLRDFTWWSGLTTADATAGIAMVRPRLAERSIDGVPYWFAAASPAPAAVVHRAFLLPAFDEYLVAYKNRGASLDPAIIVDGRVVGRWTRALSAKAGVVTLKFFGPVSASQERATIDAAGRYATFIGTPMAVRCER
jgi:hypothetical protein